jgi:hypothetical protein
MSSAASRPETALPYLDEYANLIEAGTAVEDAPRFRYQKLGMFANGFALAGDRAEARRLLATMDYDCWPPWTRSSSPAVSSRAGSGNTSGR